MFYATNIWFRVKSEILPGLVEITFYDIPDIQSFKVEVENKVQSGNIIVYSRSQVSRTEGGAPITLLCK